MGEASDIGSAEIVNDERAGRFKVRWGGQEAILTYRVLPGNLMLDHTEVPAAIEGRGVASRLAEAAFEFARAKHLRVVPLCAFVADYLGRHPEHHDLLAPATLKRLLSGQTPKRES